MKTDLADFQIDIEKATDGAWVEVGDETQLKIGRMNSPEYNRLLLKLSKPHVRQSKAGKLDPQIEREIFAKVLSRTVLLGWKNLNQNGAEIPYSRAKARDILADPRFDSFKSQVIELAQDEENFRQEEIKTDMGELPIS